MDFLLGRFLPPPPSLIAYTAAQDFLVERLECLVFTLSVNETALDPRDRGQVDFSTNVALVRIQDEVIVGKSNICIE